MISKALILILIENNLSAKFTEIQEEGLQIHQTVNRRKLLL